MKKNLTVLTILLVFSYSLAQETATEKTSIFKTITEGSYSFNRSGNLARDKVLNEKINKKQFYNEQGILIEYWRYERDGIIYEKTKLTKDNNGKLIKSITYNKDGNLKRHVTSKTDKKKKVEEFKTFDSQDELTTIQINEYDANKNQISFINTNVKSNRTFKTSSEYNSKNQLIKETDFKPDGTVRDIRTFKYDEKGNEIESDLKRPNGDYTKFISQYDEWNNLILQKWFDKDGKQKHQNSFTYVYDNNNQWITRKRYSNGELGYVWERRIEYY